MLYLAFTHLLVLSFTRSLMDIKQISIKQTLVNHSSYRPSTFVDFIWQEDTKKVLQTAIVSAKVRDASLGHILFSWESGFGKTTLAQIVSSQMQSNIKIITGYALSKPSEMISLLNSLGKNDILFIDEIHRLKPSVEEVLYIAMEDYRIDMILPDGWSLSIPLEPFTLIGATTQMEKLSPPLKNRFIYKFHFHDYTPKEKASIIKRYLQVHAITLQNESLLHDISEHLPNVPREIANTCVQIKDYLTAQDTKKTSFTLDRKTRKHFWQRSKLQKWGITPIHQKYLSILEEYQPHPVGLKTLAVRLGMNEQAVEEEIEPLLFKLRKIEKTKRGRVLL